MIIKLTLETENCEQTMMEFLKRYDYLQCFPVTMKEMNTDKNLRKGYASNHLEYVRIVKLPDTDLKDGELVLVEPTEAETEWIKTVIKAAFYRYTDSEYDRSQFSVEIVPNCNASWGNGKDFYVFPTSYSKVPVLNF